MSFFCQKKRQRVTQILLLSLKGKVRNVIDFFLIFWNFVNRTFISNYVMPGDRNRCQKWIPRGFLTLDASTESLSGCQGAKTRVAGSEYTSVLALWGSIRPGSKSIRILEDHLAPLKMAPSCDNGFWIWEARWTRLDLYFPKSTTCPYFLQRNLSLRLKIFF